MKTLKRNDINKFFDKINENVGVNWALVRTRPSGRAGDLSRDTFEKENLIKCKINKLNGHLRGFGLDPPIGIRAGIGGFVTCLLSIKSSQMYGRVL